jgi:hypothetical protein
VSRFADIILINQNKIKTKNEFPKYEHKRMRSLVYTTLSLKKVITYKVLSFSLRSIVLHISIYFIRGHNVSIAQRMTNTWRSNLSLVGLGGLVVIVLETESKVLSSNLTEDDGYLSAIKIRSTSFGQESKAVGQTL